MQQPPLMRACKYADIVRVKRQELIPDIVDLDLHRERRPQFPLKRGGDRQHRMEQCNLSHHVSPYTRRRMGRRCSAAPLAAPFISGIW